MNVLKVALFLFGLVISGSAAARHPEPVIDYSDVVVVAASGKALTVDQVRQVVRTAAEGQKWVVSDQQNGKTLATLSWKGNKHTIIVEIACAANSYSITYKDSINMKYGMVNGQQSIHPYYNRYVLALKEAIRVELMKL